MKRRDFRLWLEQVVRWADMDAMGHVNNAKYFTYCESARMAYFDAVGMGRYRDGTSFGPALVTATCNFRRQVHHPATLEVGVRATKVGTKSFTLEYVLLLAGDDDPVADGTSVVVWVDYAAGRAAPLPDDLAVAIRDYES